MPQDFTKGDVEVVGLMSLIQRVLRDVAKNTWISRLEPANPQECVEKYVNRLNLVEIVCREFLKTFYVVFSNDL